MLVQATIRRGQFAILFCAISMTIVVTPWMTLDPINLPKLFVLVLSGFSLFGLLFSHLREFFAKEVRVVVVSAAFFVMCLFSTFLFSGSSMVLQFFGTYGRNTGLLAYLSLVFVFLASMILAYKTFIKRLLWGLISTAALNAVYGLAQWRNLDPIGWSGASDPIVGTLGNSNFLSAHLGMASVASVALLAGRLESVRTQFILILTVPLLLFVSYVSKSSQGLLIFALGTAVVVYSRFFTGRRSLLMRMMYLVTSLGALIVGFFGVINRGPLALLLYQDSVTYRGDYWRAGWRMTLDQPLFGVGLDSYGDWYRFSRTEAAALRRGPEVVSNSAHNVFLDFSSNGGFPLLSAYALITLLIIRSAIRILRKAGGFDALGTGLVSSWIAYLVQSVISINQLGIAIWGWVIGGAIIGYDILGDRQETPQANRKIGKRRQQVPPLVVVTGSLGLTIGLLLSVWPVTKDISFRKGLESGDAVRTESVAMGFPITSYYLVYAAQIFQGSGLEETSLELSREAIEVNPRDFNAWKLLAANPKISESERASAIAKMKELDPFNNTLGD